MSTAAPTTAVSYVLSTQIGGSTTSMGSGQLPAAQIEHKKILVITGGSGRLGSTIARLAYDHWDDLQEIKLFDLYPPDTATVTGITGYTPPSIKPRVSYCPGNILNEDSVLGAFAKADIVIHCAAVVETGSILSRRNMKKVNVDGTHNVVQACLECGVRCLIFTGSLAQVLSENAQEQTSYDESYVCPAKSQLVFQQYGASKNEAENLVLLANGQEGKEGVTLKTCSLRFPVMYGEGDTTFVSECVINAKRCCGYMIPLGLTANCGVTMQAVYVGNAAWAHLIAAKRLLGCLDANGNEQASEKNKNCVVDVTATLESEDAGGKFYYVGDHTPITSFAKLLDQFLQPLGCRVLSFGMPFPLIRMVVFFLEFFFFFLSIFRVDYHSSLTRSTLQYMKLSHSFSWKKAKKELDYKPLFSYKVALARSMEFYRQI